jgi:hypothetical protein
MGRLDIDPVTVRGWGLETATIGGHIRDVRKTVDTAGEHARQAWNGSVCFTAATAVTTYCDRYHQAMRELARVVDDDAASFCATANAAVGADNHGADTVNGAGRLIRGINAGPVEVPE